MDNLKPFQPGESGNPSGRPKKIYTILKESGYSSDDMKAAFQEIGWQSADDIQAVLDDPSQPLIIKVIGRAFLRGAEKGDFRYVSEIIQQAIGKPKESLDANLTGDVKITLNL